MRASTTGDRVVQPVVFAYHDRADAHPSHDDAHTNPDHDSTDPDRDNTDRDAGHNQPVGGDKDQRDALRDGFGQRDPGANPHAEVKSGRHGRVNHGSANHGSANQDTNTNADAHKNAGTHKGGNQQRDDVRPVRVGHHDQGRG